MCDVCFFTISSCSGTFFSIFCHLSWVFLCHLMRAIAVSLLWDSQESQELDWLSLGWQTCLDNGKERPSCVVLLLCVFLLLPAMSWFPAFLYPSFHFWLLFAFPLHSLLFFSLLHLSSLQEDIWCVGRWGGLLPIKISCIFPLLSFFHTSCSTSDSSEASQCESVPPCSHGGDSTKGSHLSIPDGTLIRPSFFILCCILTKIRLKLMIFGFF